MRDLDLDSGTIRVDGKTGDPGGRHLAPVTILIRRRAASGRSPEEHLLALLDRAAWSENLHKKRFAAAVRRAGLDPEACFYSLSPFLHQPRVEAPGASQGGRPRHRHTSMQFYRETLREIIIADQRRYAEIACPELRSRRRRRQGRAHREYVPDDRPAARPSFCARASWGAGSQISSKIRATSLYVLSAISQYRAGAVLLYLWVHQWLSEFDMKNIVLVLVSRGISCPACRGDEARQPLERTEYTPSLDGIREILSKRSAWRSNKAAT